MSVSHWVVYDTRTGEILRYGVAPPSGVTLQAHGEHEAVIEADGSDMSHRVVDGALVSIEAAP